MGVFKGPTMRPNETSLSRPDLSASSCLGVSIEEGAKWSIFSSLLPKSKPTSQPRTRLSCSGLDMSVFAIKVLHKLAFRDGGFTLYRVQASRVFSFEQRGSKGIGSGKAELIPSSLLICPKHVMVGVCWIAL